MVNNRTPLYVDHFIPAVNINSFNQDHDLSLDEVAIIVTMKTYLIVTIRLNEALISTSTIIFPISKPWCCVILSNRAVILSAVAPDQKTLREHVSSCRALTGDVVNVKSGLLVLCHK